MNKFKRIAFAAFFGIMVATVVYMSSQTILYRPFLRYQNTIDDSHFLRRFLFSGDAKGVTDDIVIVDIDSRSIEALGQFNRWPHSHFAEVIGTLDRDGARLIFLDAILRSAYRRNNRDIVDLADTLRAVGNVVGGYYFNLDGYNRRRRPLDVIFNEQFSLGWPGSRELEERDFISASEIIYPDHDFVMSTSAIGFTNYLPDRDGVLRHIPLFISYRGLPMPAVSLQMWLTLKGLSYTDADISSRGVRFDDTFIPTDRHSFMRLNFISSGPVFQYVSFRDVLTDDFTPGTFRDKIVMIGSSAENLRDLKAIPGYQALPGVEIHATALANMISGDFLRVFSGNAVFLLTALCGMAVSLVFMFLPTFRVGLPVALGGPLMLYIAAIYGFIRHSILINVTVPTVTIILLYVVIAIHRVVECYESKSRECKEIRQ